MIKSEENITNKEDLQMKNINIKLEELTCPSCITKIETAIKRVDGVEDVKVLFNSSKVKASIDEEKVSIDKLKRTVSNLGYKVLDN